MLNAKQHNLKYFLARLEVLALMLMQATEHSLIAKLSTMRKILLDI